MFHARFFLFITLLQLACGKSTTIPADLMIYNAQVHQMDSLQIPAEAVVVRDGKIVFVGSESDARKLYTFKEEQNLQGQHVYPGWHDAHAHFYGYGMMQQQVDLSSCKSWDEVIKACVAFYERYKPAALTGRGWDQNLWSDPSFPEHAELNKLFPTIPVLLKRVDGHAAIANDYLLKQAGIDAATKIDGGELITKNGVLTGVLIDNAVDLVAQFLPHPDRNTQIKALKRAADTCLSYGLTAITDAGLPTDIVLLIDSLQQAGDLGIRFNAMVSVDSTAIAYWKKRGPLHTDQLEVNGFKMYADGALGSRGACLLQPYSDAAHYGMLITDTATMLSYIRQLAQSPFQLNTHCIGDSANRLLLQYYSRYLKPSNERCWRIEHAQVVNPMDYLFFKNYAIIPSVQPTHATSDMLWAEARLGNQRIHHAYAYQQLLQLNGWMPLGTDFPVEAVNPMYTLVSATYRMNREGQPREGFQKEDALSFWQTVYGMTLWAAKAARTDSYYGAIRAGLWADFVVYPSDLSKLSPQQLLQIRPSATYFSGKKVFAIPSK